MMKEVVYGLMAIFISGYILYYLTPMLFILKSAGLQAVDSNDPVIANYFALGDGLYSIIGLVGFGVIGFLLFSYATRNEII